MALPDRTGTVSGVDLLRAIAIGLVLLYHFVPIGQAGWTGVDLFFLISGFLIGGGILGQVWDGRFSFARFYGRRALRILPTYYFVVLLGALFRSHDGASLWMAIKSIGASMLFLQTIVPYFFAGHIQLDPSFEAEGAWSLVIEEVFYLLAPAALILFVWLARRRPGIVAAMLAIVVLSGPLTRWLMDRGFAPDDANWYFASFVQFHSRYDELAAGVLAACLLRLGIDFRRFSSWLLLGGLGFCWLFLAYIFDKPEFLAQPWLITQDTIWLPTLFAIGGLLLLLAAYWWPVHWPPVILLARISYPLYLSHALFLVLVHQYGEHGLIGWMGEAFGPDGRNVIYLGGALVIAYLVSLLVEYPFLRLYKSAASRQASVDAVAPSLLPSTR